MEARVNMTILGVDIGTTAMKMGVFEEGEGDLKCIRQISDKFAMDPSSASLTAMYNTGSNNMTWNKEILAAFDLDVTRLDSAKNRRY